MRALLIGAGIRGMQWAKRLADHPRWRLAGAVDPDLPPDAG